MGGVKKGAGSLKQDMSLRERTDTEKETCNIEGGASRKVGGA